MQQQSNSERPEDAAIAKKRKSKMKNPFKAIGKKFGMTSSKKKKTSTENIDESSQSTSTSSLLFPLQGENAIVGNTTGQQQQGTSSLLNISLNDSLASSSSVAIVDQANTHEMIEKKRQKNEELRRQQMAKYLQDLEEKVAKVNDVSKGNIHKDYLFRSKMYSLIAGICLVILFFRILASSREGENKDHFITNQLLSIMNNFEQLEKNVVKFSSSSGSINLFILYGFGILGISTLYLGYKNYQDSFSSSKKMIEEEVYKVQESLKAARHFALETVIEELDSSKSSLNTSSIDGQPGGVVVHSSYGQRNTGVADGGETGGHPSELQKLRDFMHLPHMPHLPHLPHPHTPKFARDLSARFRAGSRRKLGGKNLNPDEIFPPYKRPEGDPPTDVFKKYCYDNLPLEQTYDLSEDEAEFVKVLIKETKDDKEGGFEALPRDIRLMLLRGYADKKDRLTLSLIGIRYINDWRKRYDVDNLLKKRVDNDKEYFGSWACDIGGNDEFGHPIILESVEGLNTDILLDIEEFRFFQLRTAHLEAVHHYKQQLSERRGHRVCKHIYIFDLKKLSPSMFTQRVRNIIPPIFKVSGDCYPDSLWTLWLINAPMSFRFVWSVISPWIDPVVKTKIRLLGGPSTYLPMMEATGIPLSSIPVQIGGTYKTKSLHEFLIQCCNEANNNNKDGSHLDHMGVDDIDVHSQNNKSPTLSNTNLNDEKQQHQLKQLASDATIIEE